MQGLAGLAGLAINTRAIACKHSEPYLPDCEVPALYIFAWGFVCMQVVKLWQADLAKINPKAAESLANPEASACAKCSFALHLVLRVYYKA